VCLLKEAPGFDGPSVRGVTVNGAIVCTRTVGLYHPERSVALILSAGVLAAVEGSSREVIEV
jgi:hypothetical protein